MVNEMSVSGKKAISMVCLVILAMSGCRSSWDAAKELEAAFPEEAPRVLGRNRNAVFAPTDYGFAPAVRSIEAIAGKPPAFRPLGGLTFRYDGWLPRVYYQAKNAQELFIGETGLEGEGSVADGALWFSKRQEVDIPRSASFWSSGEHGYEEWLFLQPNLGDQPPEDKEIAAAEWVISSAVDLPYLISGRSVAGRSYGGA